MKIDKILSGIRQTQEVVTSKEASEKPAAPATDKTATPRDALVGALNSALSTEKTASENANPVKDVMKIAEELAGAEHEAQVKQAQVLGTAFADAFVARLGVWQKSAAEILTTAPTASATATVPATNYNKFAAENTGLVTQAQNLGYAETRAALEKQANDLFNKGFEDTTALIHKTAAHEFLKGAAVMDIVLDAALKA